jgi:predicted transcriptional regulator of viral defense system
MNMDKLIGYALRLGVGSVIRRLGYLLEIYGLAQESDLSRLQDALSRTYVPLDPLLPRDGAYLARWRLHLNISAAELNHLRNT